jgi:O-antigen biosynthesis protein
MASVPYYPGKHDALAVEESPSAGDGVSSRVERPTTPTSSVSVARLPLSALRVTLDQGSAQARWSVDPDGVAGRALIQSAASVVTIPLRLAGAIQFSARLRLLPHDWRDGAGTLRAWVAVTEPDGAERTLWSGSLMTAALHEGKPNGLAVTCEVPATSTALKLGIGPRSSGTGQLIARAAWIDAEVADPAGGVPPGLAPSPQSASAPHSPAPSDKPLISVLTPVHNPPVDILEEAIASVRAQSFTAWELCLVDDGSNNPEVIASLERHAASDCRIHLERHEAAGGISAATNTALALATGEYIALLDHDDTLTPDALERVADQIAAQPDLDMIYSDEDTVLDGRPIWLHLKPDWSPDTLQTNCYTCHLGVYRRALVSEIGGFRSEFDGSQDHDMILRLVERTDRIAHVPWILYHWRVHPGSTAGGEVKPYAYVAARNAIASHLERCGIEAEVGYGPPGLYRVAHRVDPQLNVALVLAVDDPRGLDEAARSWASQPHPTWSIMLAAPAHALAACADALRAADIAESRVKAVAIKPEWDYPTALAAATAAAAADYLLIMQNPLVGLTHDWLTRLLGYSSQPEIAAAGPIVLGRDGRIAEAGIALPEGVPLHLLYGDRSSMDNLFGYGTSVYNVSAVSGVLATSRETYEELGGLDPRLEELALIDYCLRATDAGQRVVIVPDARVRATGRDTTVNDLPTVWRLRERWAQTHTRDAYYNPNYRADRGDFEPIRG